MAVSICLSVSLLFVTGIRLYVTSAAERMQWQRVSRVYSHMKNFATPREICACGGGSLMVPINTHTCFLARPNTVTTRKLTQLNGVKSHSSIIIIIIRSCRQQRSVASTRSGHDDEL